MSLLVLVVFVAGVTVVSRMAPMLLVRPLDGLAGEVIERLPAPLFAALAVLSLPSAGAAPDPAIWAAMVGALLVRWVRSLLLTLAAGLTGYLIVATVLG